MLNSFFEVKMRSDQKEAVFVSTSAAKKNPKRKGIKSRMSFPAVEGCYFISCLCKPRIYIGRSMNMNKRISSHIQALNGGRHEIPAMQSDFDRFGSMNFAIGIFFRVDNQEGRDLDRETILAKCAYIGAMEREIALFSSRDTPLGTVSGPLLSEARLYQIASPVYRKTSNKCYRWNEEGWRGELVPGAFTPKINKTLFASASTAVEAVTASLIPSGFLYNRDSFKSPNRSIMLHYLLAGEHFKKLGKPMATTFIHEGRRLKGQCPGEPRRLFLMEEYYHPCHKAPRP